MWQKKVKFPALQAPMWHCSSGLTTTGQAQRQATRTELEIIPHQYQLHQMEIIIAFKNNSYKCSIKESVKDRFVLFGQMLLSPDPIFRKVHLSAISLPRK